MWQSIGHLLHERAATIGDRSLLTFNDANLSFAEVEARTNRLANVLASYGVLKGDRVAVMLANGLDFPIGWLAIAKLGAVMVPVNIHYRESELESTLNDSGAKLALCGEDQLEILQRVCNHCLSLRRIGGFAGSSNLPHGAIDLRAEMAEASPVCPIANVSRDDVLNIQYTSGTTGFPKGCMLTHEYWILLGQTAAEYGKFQDDDVALTAQPFYYMDPQWNTVMCMLAGIPLVILPRFSVSTFWQSVKDNNVTFFYVVGSMAVYLLKQPEDPEVDKGHRVRFVLCSGIVPRLHSIFESRWNVPWRETYGTTESGADLFVPIEDTGSVGTGAMGRPIPGKEAKVVDDNARELADGEVGELTIRGKPMMLGYYNKSEATAEKIRHGWMNTGDLVFRDERGYFHMVGRLKDMIRRSGENISAAEVEAVLCEHQAVLAAAVIAVPDELRGEEVKAFIQLQPSETAETVPPQALVDFARRYLAAFKVPRFIEYVDAFQRTPTERLAKHKLLEQREDQRAGAYDANTQTWN